VDEIRPFRLGSPEIDAAVERAVANLPASASGAVVATAKANSEGAQLAIAARRGSNWTFVGVLEKPYAGKLEGLAEVRYTW
jgi:hypothetical protein